MKPRIIAVSAAALIFFFASTSSNSYVVFVHAHPSADNEATIRNVNKYQIAFQQYPKIARAGENATLHFTILDSTDSSSVQGIYAAILMKEKDTGKVVQQMPYRFYEFGDISIPYKLQSNEDYVVTLLARTTEDPSKPLQADFDVSVGQTMSSSVLLMMFVPFAAALAGGIIFMLRRK
ncbi:MAG TPA: hypothetical protein VF172_03630 [Nitrososphaera sp.]|jgi:hypothetical protein